MFRSLRFLAVLLFCISVFVRPLVGADGSDGAQNPSVENITINVIEPAPAVPPTVNPQVTDAILGFPPPWVQYIAYIAAAAATAFAAEYSRRKFKNRKKDCSEPPKEE